MLMRSLTDSRMQVKYEKHIQDLSRVRKSEQIFAKNIGYANKY